MNTNQTNSNNDNLILDKIFQSLENIKTEAHQRELTLYELKKDLEHYREKNNELKKEIFEIKEEINNLSSMMNKNIKLQFVLLGLEENGEGGVVNDVKNLKEDLNKVDKFINKWKNWIALGTIIAPIIWVWFISYLKEIITNH